MRKPSNPAILGPLLFALAGAIALPAPAQGRDDPEYDDESDQQTVARVAYFTGQVSFSRGDDPDNWRRAGLNFPMTLGDRVYTGRGARLELQMTGANVYLAPNTDLAALNLTTSVRQLSISEGLASFRIRSLGRDESFEVDTPNASVTFDRPGDYRIEVTSRGSTRVSVARGSALVAAGGGEVSLRAGDLMEIDGLDRPTYDVVTIARRDSWDSWVESRARRLATSESVRYVHEDVFGAEDLDDYGRWDNIPEYGRCWSPRTVRAGWAPYRDGRWAWQDPWGWSWVSSEPWGFAPYHWGRWINYRSRWFWVPVGRSTRVATYSPALVAFVGTGAGWSASVSFGGGGQIGWFPLAPRDSFVPWWGSSRRRTNVNAPHEYANRSHMTVVSQGTFTSGGAVAPFAIRDPGVIRQMADAPVSHGKIPYIPVAASLRVSTAAAPASLPRPSADVLRKSVVTRLAPPPAPPSFQMKAPVIRENRGEPIAPGVAIQLDAQRGGRKTVQPVRPVVTEPGRVSLSPRKESAPAPAPAAVAAPHGRPFATNDRPITIEPPRKREAPAAEVAPPVPPAARSEAPPRRDESRPAARAIEERPPAPQPAREAPRAVQEERREPARDVKAEPQEEGKRGRPQPKAKPDGKDKKDDKDTGKEDKKNDGKDGVP